MTLSAHYEMEENSSGDETRLDQSSSSTTTVEAAEMTSEGRFQAIRQMFESLSQSSHHPKLSKHPSDDLPSRFPPVAPPDPVMLTSPRYSSRTSPRSTESSPDSSPREPSPRSSTSSSVHSTVNESEAFDHITSSRVYPPVSNGSLFSSSHKEFSIGAIIPRLSLSNSSKNPETKRKNESITQLRSGKNDRVHFAASPTVLPTFPPSSLPISIPYQSTFDSSSDYFEPNVSPLTPRETPCDKAEPLKSGSLEACNSMSLESSDGAVSRRQRSTSQLNRFKLLFRQKICRFLEMDKTTEVTLQGLMRTLIDCFDREIAKEPASSSSTSSSSSSTSSSSKAPPEERLRIVKLLKSWKTSATTPFDAMVILRLKSLQAICLNEPLTGEEAQDKWLKQLQDHILAPTQSYNSRVESTSSKGLKTNSPIKHLFKAHKDMGQCTAQYLVTQAIGMESLAFLKKVIQGDKRLFEDYIGIRGPKGQTKPTWITEEEIESLRTELVKRVYMWPIQGEASPTIWSLVEDGISPEAAEQKRAAEQKKLIELVRCIATSEAALFHHISILHSGAEMINLPNRYGKGKDLERPEHVVKDIVSALHASGWFSNHSIEEDIASILQYKHTPYSLPLYSLGNVLFDIYMVARGIIYDPNSGLSAPVIKPGAPVIHKIEITSKTTFTTETQKTYLMKRDLFDGVWEVLSEHTMVTKTDWDAAQQMLVKATFSIDGSFTEKASPLVRQAITLHWQEKSDKRLKAQLEK